MLRAAFPYFVHISTTHLLYQKQSLRLLFIF